MSSEEQRAADRVAAFIGSLGVEVQRVGQGRWSIELEAAGHPLPVAIRIRWPLLAVEAAVLPAGLIDPHQLLVWNHQTPFVAFAEDDAGDILVTGELPLEQLGTETLDRLLGLTLANATRAREFLVPHP